MLIFGEPVFFLRTTPKTTKNGRGKGKAPKGVGNGHGKGVGLNHAAVVAAQPSLARGYGYNYGNNYGNGD